MQLRNYPLLLTTILVALVSGWCGKDDPPKQGNSVTPDAPALKSAAPQRLLTASGEEVTFFPSYGYREGNGWTINVRGWVHQNRDPVNKIVTKLVAAVATVRGKCDSAEIANFQSRSNDFEDDDKSLEKVIIKFDFDPEAKLYEFNKRSGANGIVELDLSLTDERAKQLLASEKSANGWLTFSAVSRDHTGRGRIRLIEPEGVSLISDIDDTIKVTDIPAGKETVLKNTFCRDFKALPEMAKSYIDLGDVPVHYVSGGPQQMFGPLYDFLIVGPGGFPEGTFHLNFFPKNFLSADTQRLALGGFKSTFDHKVDEIRKLMKRFPRRQFILVGDSGEVDPEVYKKIRSERPDQVKEIRIRDLINDADPNANPYRLEGMTVIKVDPVVCLAENHFRSLFEKLKEIDPTRKYRRNTAVPCGG
ncbi:MAG TPA: phosphatase domain-containing protein [Pyrinomonadaceae bacterium]|nr:phosphatase domain-containing protein [Pyrinomonadaceae bacterium]